jgi:hypothetical protein
MRAMRPGQILSVLAVALVLGLCAGWVDLHNDEVQATVLVIVVSAGALGFLAPRSAVLAGLVVGLGVPIAHLYARLTEFALPYPVHNYAESFIALVPAVLTAVIGAGVRKVITPGMYRH